MEAKVAIALSVLAFFAVSSDFHSPVEAFPRRQELKHYQVASSKNDVDCSTVKDGIKIPSPYSCSEYFECVHGVAYLFQCANMTDGEQLYFNQTLQSCNWPWEVQCEISSTEPTPVTESSSDSSTKEEDDDDKGGEDNDDNDDNDDEEEQEEEEDVELLRAFAPIEDTTVDCSEVENGEKISSPTNCSEYYVCVMGRAYLYQCPIMASGGRLYYDPELEVCNWPWLVDCEITTTESPTTTTMITEPSPTTEIEHVSTTTSQMNSTTLKPTTDITTISTNTPTEEPITSEKPQTSTQPDDKSTTSKATSSQPLSTTTTQETITTTTQKSTEPITTTVDLTTAEPTTIHVDSTTTDVTTEASTPAIKTTTMEPVTSEKSVTSTESDDSSTTSEDHSSTDIPVSTSSF